MKCEEMMSHLTNGKFLEKRSTDNTITHFLYEHQGTSDISLMLCAFKHGTCVPSGLHK
jgi:hypothetical protein